MERWCSRMPVEQMGDISSAGFRVVHGHTIALLEFVRDAVCAIPYAMSGVDGGLVCKAECFVGAFGGLDDHRVAGLADALDGALSGLERAFCRVHDQGCRFLGALVRVVND